MLPFHMYHDNKAALIIQRKKGKDIARKLYLSFEVGKLSQDLVQPKRSLGATYATMCTFILSQQFFRGVNNKIKKYVTSEKEQGHVFTETCET